jgi:uncharacterized protein
MNVSTQGLLRFQAAGGEYVFSGHTGLLLRSSPALDEALAKPSSALEEKLGTCLYGKHQSQRTLRVGASKQTPLQNVTVFVTNECNLDCSYCYVRKNGISNSGRMSLDTFRSAMELFSSCFDMRRRVNILFFGGEPFMNLGFLKGATGYLDQIAERDGTQFTYSIVTNGTILNQEVLDFVVRNGVSVVVSIDGSEEVHDRTRPFRNGKGSHATVLRNVGVLSQYCNLAARVTVCDLNTDLVRLYEDLRTAGFWEVHATVVSDANAASADLEPGLSQLRQRLREMEDHFLANVREKRLVRFGHVAKYLKLIHLGYRSGGNAKVLPCSAGYSSFSVAANGDIYLCHRFNNVADVRFGSVADGLNWERRENFLDTHQVSARRGACASCWAAAFCGGTCYHTSYAADAEMRTVNELHCACAREWVLSALRVYVSMSAEERCVLENIG